MLTMSRLRRWNIDYYNRTADAARFGRPMIITNESLRFTVAEQMRQIGMATDIVLEPSARNTAPAVAAAALLASQADPEALILIMPSDHAITEPAAFLRAIDLAAQAARQDFLVTFSITPTRPATGYGYVRRGHALAGHEQVFAVDRFVEKPDLQRATEFVASGDYAWNSGIFLFKARAFLAELAALWPAVLAAVTGAVDGKTRDLDFIRLAAGPFQASPSISVDYAVMERTKRAATLPCSIGWNDVGDWSEIWNIGEHDARNNVLKGDVMAEDCDGCLISSDGRLVAALGVRNLVVVVTDDAVLVVEKDRAQDVKLLTERLRAAKRSEASEHSQVYRPWGHYQSIQAGDRYQVKRLQVNPGGKLSLQKHYHRAEHWVVVNGTARVTRDNETFLLHENQSTYLPLGAVHRLENPGKVPLTLIEVQSGGYLGEDDIERMSDSYGRA